MTNYADPYTQILMIIDRVRTDAYFKAIERVVNKGDVVMDLGTGSGLLSLFAASLGAKKVYACERTAAILFISSAVRENGFSDIVEIINADIMHLDLNTIWQRPRIIISETLGNLPQNESIHQLFAKVKPIIAEDAVFIPKSYYLLFAAAAPGMLRRIRDELDDIHGITLRSLDTAARSKILYTKIYKEELLSLEYPGGTISLLEPFPAHHSCSIEISESGTVTAIIVSFCVQLVEEVSISTSVNSSPTSWKQAVFPLIEPIVCQKGNVLRADLYMNDTDLHDEKNWQWTVSKL
jgi:hypothetical protein